jgi:hypothetical protein
MAAAYYSALNIVSSNWDSVCGSKIVKECDRRQTGVKWADNEGDL